MLCIFKKCQADMSTWYSKATDMQDGDIWPEHAETDLAKLGEI